MNLNKPWCMRPLLASDFSDEMSLPIPAPVHYSYAMYTLGKAIPQRHVFHLTK